MRGYLTEDCLRTCPKRLQERSTGLVIRPLMKNLRHTRKYDDISLLVLLSCNNPSSLAVKYFFMTNDGTNSDAELVINPFNAVEEQNDYEVGVGEMHASSAPFVDSQLISSLDPMASPRHDRR